MDYKPQVERSHYFKRHYISPERFASYGHQVQEILNCNPEKVLEVGIGNGFVSDILRKVGLEVTTLDLDANLNPDIVASVIDMPFSDNAFDLVGCFEVLEHLPYKYLPRVLSEISRITCKYAMISLPDVRHLFSVKIILPRLGKRDFSFSFQRLTKKSMRMTDEHYWEIGRSHYPLKRIIKEMESSGFNVLNTYLISEKPEHRFFRLQKMF